MAPPIGSTFGDRSNPNGWPRETPHRGVDIMAPAGTKIFASIDGTVVESGYVVDPRSEAQYVVSIQRDRAPGAPGAVVVQYQHLRIVYPRRGAHVRAGQPLGEIGTHVTGDHLHYGVFESGLRVVDPVPYLAIDGVVECVDADRRYRPARAREAPARGEPAHLYPVECAGGHAGPAALVYR